MGGKIDTDQFFFFIQAFEVAPTFTFGNLRFGDGDKSISSEQGIGSRALVCLELIAIANQCFKEYFSFPVSAKNCSRWMPKLSKAPANASDSMFFLLQAVRLTRSTKSKISLYGPFSSVLQ